MIENMSSAALIISLLIIFTILMIIAAVILSPILFTAYLKKGKGQQSNGFSITLWIFFIPVHFNNLGKTSKGAKHIGHIDHTDHIDHFNYTKHPNHSKHIKRNATTKKNIKKTSGYNIKKVRQGKYLVPLIRKFIASIIGNIEISKLKFHLSFGLDDPADSGLAYGLLSSVMYPFKVRFPLSDIQISPNFVEPMCEYDIEGMVKVRMFNLLYAILCTFISRNMYVFIRGNLWKN